MSSAKGTLKTYYQKVKGEEFDLDDLDPSVSVLL